MPHAQKPDFVFWWNGQVHLNRRRRQFSRLLAAVVCASAVVMLDTPCSEFSVKGTGYPPHSPVSPHFPSLVSPCAITFQLESNKNQTFGQNERSRSYIRSVIYWHVTGSPTVCESSGVNLLKENIISWVVGPSNNVKYMSFNLQ